VLKKNRDMKRRRIAAIFLLIILAPLPVWAAAVAKIVWPKALAIPQGTVMEVKVAGDDLAVVEGIWGKQKIYFYPGDKNNFSALMGADVDAKPALGKLSLKVATSRGAHFQKDVALRVKPKAYLKESFQVPASFDEMTAETLAEIRGEQQAFARAFATTSAERLWSGPFIRPVPQEASASSFGSRRIINGIARAPHAGTDLSAPLGTEVMAVNDGRVVLVGNFFFAGGSVVLDHGCGLFTMYFHLSDFKVGEGLFVRKGDVLALSGATGRVTGPHLHWGVRLNNARVDPLDLLRKFSEQTNNPLDENKPESKLE
jgi:murein DD-endopeptidase MepM/ murein hydrolase activator NlpD